MEACRFPVGGIASLDAETPILAIDLGAFAASARDLASRHAAAHVQWCPATSWGGVRSVAKLLQVAGATGVSAGSLAEAVSAVSVGFGAVSVAIPPVMPRQATRFANLCRAASMTVVCDHFAQTELIARACQEAETVSRVLLRVDVGLERLGVRPGPDLSDLAEGVGRLPGVRLAGVWIAGPSIAAGVGRLKGSELSRLFERCRASLTRAGYETSTLSVFDLDQIKTCASSATETRARVPADRESSVTVLAGVIARPTRDLAVVDAGRGLLGTSARIAGQRGAAEVASVDEDFAVLRLTPDQQDYAIGDVVALIPEPAVKPQPGRTVLVASDGVWRAERVC